MKTLLQKLAKALFYAGLPLLVLFLWYKLDRAESQLDYVNWKTNQNTHALCNLFVDELCREYKLVCRSRGTASTCGDVEFDYLLAPGEGHDQAVRERLVRDLESGSDWLLRFSEVYRQPPHLRLDIRLADGSRENENEGELVVSLECRRNADGSPADGQLAR